MDISGILSFHSKGSKDLSKKTTLSANHSRNSPGLPKQAANSGRVPTLHCPPCPGSAAKDRRGFPLLFPLVWSAVASPGSPGSLAMSWGSGPWGGQGRCSPVSASLVGLGVQRRRNLTRQEFTTTLSLGLRLRLLTMPGTQ